MPHTLRKFPAATTNAMTDVATQTDLKGTDIPVHARIVAVADSYDAMNSRRIYRNALPP